jgi:hypothetical protein
VVNPIVGEVVILEEVIQPARLQMGADTIQDTLRVTRSKGIYQLDPKSDCKILSRGGWDELVTAIQAH